MDEVIRAAKNHNDCRKRNLDNLRREARMYIHGLTMCAAICGADISLNEDENGYFVSISIEDETEIYL